ncbi:MAG: ATPase, T2SS/T4P/T4SS family [bacterium]
MEDKNSRWIKHLLDIKAISSDGLETALKEQEKTGGRLGEILVINNLIDKKKLEKSIFGIYSGRNVGEILVEDGVISQTQLEKALTKQKNGKGQLTEILLEENLVNDEQVAKALAKQQGLEYISLENFFVDKGLFKEITVEKMRDYLFIPYKKEGNVLTIAVSDPANLVLLDELKILLGTQIKLVVSTERAIKNILENFENKSNVLQEMAEDLGMHIIKEDGEEEKKEENITELEDKNNPVIKMVDSIINNAIRKRASDIHVEAREEDISVKYRIDGVLYPAMEKMAKKFHEVIVSRIKIMSELNIAEKRIPQDGRFKIRYEGRNIDFRVSVIPGNFGENVVIRILDKIALDLDLTSLGFDPEELERFKKEIIKPYGMILVTGPTGSGKTTTLYAAISAIYTPEEKIITIEDPIEYQLSGVTQVPVNEKKGLTFARGLRSILRHDPDKIMVGEIRDPETAQIAVQSALTGHLVFSTIHANNVVDVITRLINMGIEPYNFVSALNCMIAQRLVRSICRHCKVSIKIPEKELLDSGIDLTYAAGRKFYKGKGCEHCNWTGYFGRKAIFELIHLSDNIKEMILEKKPFSEIKLKAKEEGMVFLREAALKKVFDGETTLKEVNRVTFVE